MGWRVWLESNHARSGGVWLVTYKKHLPDLYVSWDEVVEEALCFGWIDSLPRKLDTDRTMLWLAPRKPGSGWSRVNKQRVEKLIAAGRMTPAGMTKIAKARQDGSWDTLNAVDDMVIPPDLAETLDRLPPARQNFEAFPRSVRRGILEWIANAKTDATRGRRVAETAQLASQNIRANQWRQ